jgi:HK97 family phage prohead protease
MPETAPALERKQFSLADFQWLGDTANPGGFAGYASVFNEVDAYGDTIVRGAYATTLHKWLSDGFIAWGHDDRLVVAYPTKALEDDRGLWIEASFHSPPDAQAARQVVLERTTAGKRSGLSIGYFPKRTEQSADGARRLLEVDLVEVSLVMAPADDHARVASVKMAGEVGEPGEPVTDAIELKPFPNEHACRLRDPGDFQDGSFRRTTRESDGKTYSIIMGRLKGQSTMTEQAYRYPKDSWSVSEARSHCRGHDGKLFEPASTDKSAPCACASAGTPADWADHAHLVTLALDSAAERIEGFYARARARADLRAKEGRRLSDQTRSLLSQVIEAESALGAAFEVLRQLLRDTEPPAKARLNLDLVAAEARLRRRGLLTGESDAD